MNVFINEFRFVSGSCGETLNLENQQHDIQNDEQLVVKDEDASVCQSADFYSELLSLEREKLNEIKRHHTAVEVMLQKSHELLKQIIRS